MDRVPSLEPANITDTSILDNALSQNLGKLSATERNILQEQAESVLSSYKSCSKDELRNGIELFLEGSTSIPPVTEAPDLVSSVQKPKSPDEMSLIKGRLDDVQRLMQIYNIRPRTEDFSDEPIALMNKLKMPSPADLPRALRRLVEKHVTLKEEEATLLATEYTEKYGSKSLFRAAFREFYTTELIGVQQTFWRPDPRSRRIRRQAEEICLQAIDERLWLNGAEILFVIRATRSFPEDAMAFWRWVSANRLTYLAVRDMLDLRGTSIDDTKNDPLDD
ncbi:hypothetical protein AJ79_10306 [Helicocarpus griseus UAMH5409]|uniref:Uncharacterized protein n=1 Tax=Helicocarpus griseus UAMH5409 TaxID=1447875 RepID=A0A2B7WEL3_9EURO|nr:hypothetical protein AJ79_10306 [Helicocarpus griseus UAMH5409]